MMENVREQNVNETAVQADAVQAEAVQDAAAVKEVCQVAEKDFSKLGLMFLAGTAVIYAAQILVGMIAKAINPAWVEEPTIGLILSVLPLYLVGMPALIALVKKIPGTAPEQHKMKAGQFIVAFIMCYCVMYSSNLVGTIITTIIGAIKGQAIDNVVLNIATNANMVVTFIYMVICAPIMEEYIFRKLIVDRTLKYGQGVAVLVSGVMFGLFHGNLSQFIYATTLGMFLAFLYVKTGKLKITIALHMIINFMGSILGVLLLDLIKYDEYMQIAMSGNTEELMTFVMSNIAGWAVYLLYAGFLVVMVITGIVLFIVCRKRFVLEAGEVSIPKNKRLATIFLNFGMLVYCLFWLVMIVMQLVK